MKKKSFLFTELVLSLSFTQYQMSLLLFLRKVGIFSFFISIMYIIEEYIRNIGICPVSTTPQSIDFRDKAHP